MRTRLIIVVAAAALAVVAVVGIAAGEGDDSAPPAAFAAKTVRAGAIDVKLQPHHVDASGAEFEITLDTHATDLDMDLVTGASLQVGGRTWPAVAWDGDGPGDHHREGQLRFDAGGPIGNSFELRLAGFEEPVVATWAAGGGQ